MYTKCKRVPEFSRRGQFIADAAGHRLIEANAPRAYRLKSAAGRTATLAVLVAACRERGSHGRHLDPTSGDYWHESLSTFRNLF
jgi:hypothetical protein